MKKDVAWVMDAKTSFLPAPNHKKKPNPFREPKGFEKVWQYVCLAINIIDYECAVSNLKTSCFNK